MNKIALLTVGLMVGVASQQEAVAYSRTTTPWSKTRVALTSAATTAPVGFVALIISGFIVDEVAQVKRPAGEYWFYGLASLLTAPVAWFIWKGFSSYTAQGYSRAAQDIMSGNKCSQPEVFDLVQKSGGDAQIAADLVANYYAAQKNELVKAVNALEELSNQLSLAHHYFDVAKKDVNDADADLMTGMQEIIESYLTVIKAASLNLKSRSDFERQNNAETQELKVYAQLATARAIREAAYASRVNYTYTTNYKK